MSTHTDVKFLAELNRWLRRMMDKTRATTRLIEALKDTHGMRRFINSMVLSIFWFVILYSLGGTPETWQWWAAVLVLFGVIFNAAS